MGYSIGIRTRTPLLKIQMLEFMGKHYHSWPMLKTGKDGNCYASAPTDDLSYDHAKSVIGINYGVCHGWEREWAYTIVRWMALKVGTNRRRFPSNVTTETPTPFYVYDGCESTPILVSPLAKLPRKLQHYATDKYGVPRQLSEIAGYAAFESADKDALQALLIPDERARTRALLKIPSIKASVDKGLALFRQELKRLDFFWTYPEQDDPANLTHVRWANRD